MDKLGNYELNQIYCGECSEMMSHLPADSIPFWLTSPPYDGLRTYKGYTFDFEAIARELWRITQPGGVGVWVVADETKNGSESGTSFRQALYFIGLGFNLHDTMIYQTNKPPMNDRRYQACFEYMFVFSKGVPKTTNIIKELPLHPGVNNSGGMRGKDGEKRARTYINRTNDNVPKLAIWYIPRSSSTEDSLRDGHPATFPEALARDHILSWSSPGDLVLDPMAGSGTVAKMSILTGRQFLGFEISQEYVDLARRRVEMAMSQPFLPGMIEIAQPQPVQMGLGVSE